MVASASPKQMIADQAKSSRFEKLYRTLFNKFMNEDFIQTKDLLREIKHIHQRIDQLNQKVDTNFKTLAASLNGHTHVWSGGNGGGPVGGVTQPPPAPFTPAETPVPLIAFEKLETEKRNLELFAQGPSLAPAGDGLSPQAAKASATALSDSLA